MNEIRQNGKIVISADDRSIEMIFNNLIGKNMQGKQYTSYLKFAFGSGFRPGPIELYKNGRVLQKEIIPNV